MELPPNIECIEEANLLIWRPRGVLDEAAVNEILEFLNDREIKRGRDFNRFTDMTALDAVDLSFKYVFQVALFRRLARMGQGSGEIGFSCHRPGGRSLREGPRPGHATIAAHREDV